MGKSTSARRLHSFGIICHPWLKLKFIAYEIRFFPVNIFIFHSQLASRFFEDIYLFGVPRAGADLGQDSLRNELS